MCGWNKADELGIMDVEGNAIGYAKTEFLKDVFFGSESSVGISVEVLGSNLLGFPVPCRQRDNSNGGEI